jgi:hypothetical protein
VVAEDVAFSRPAITADKNGNAYVVGFIVSNTATPPYYPSAAYTTIKNGTGGTSVFFASLLRMLYVDIS